MSVGSWEWDVTVVPGEHRAAKRPSLGLFEKFAITIKHMERD